MGPRIEHLGDELRPKVDGDALGDANRRLHSLQKLDDALPSQRYPDRNRRTHPAHGIDYRSDSVLAAVDQPVGQELHAPVLLCALRRWWEYPWRTR
jgi:hypothetical protein